MLIKTTLVTVVLLLSLPAYAAAEPAQESLTDRPKIGLVLSGGGARGVAHIGVLQALHDMNVPVDYIAGTSIGSIIGGLYASGLSPTALEAMVRSINWDEMLSSEVQWQDRRFQDRKASRKYFLGVEFGLNTEGGVAPSAVLAGQRAQLLLRRMTAGLNVSQFDELPIPFRAVSTDVNAAEPYVFASGDLATAMRASMAIPLIFDPVRIDDHVLVDGGILNNLPVDVARDMGADVIIAVNVSSPLGKIDDSSSLVSIAYRSIDASLVQNTIQSLSQADLVIAPDLSDLDAADFDRTDDMLNAGYAAVKAKQRFLETLSLNVADYAEYRASIQESQRKAPGSIQFVRFSGNRRTAEPRLAAVTEHLIGETVDHEALEATIRRLLAFESFVSVDYRYVNNAAGQTGIEFAVREKPWGPDYLAFGLEIASDFDIATEFNLLLRHRRLNINALGAEWVNDVSIGTDLIYESEFYQPLDVSEQQFVAARAHASRLQQRVVDRDELLARYDVDTLGVSAAYGVNFGNSRFESYLYRGQVQSDREVGIPDGFAEFDDDQAAVGLRFQHDSLNKAHLANKGWLVDMRFDRFLDAGGGDHEYSGADFSAVWRQPFASFNALHLEARGQWRGDATGLLPDSAYVTMGGMDDLAGFAEDALIGTRSFLLRAGTLSDVQPLDIPVLGPPRILAMVHAGHVWDQTESVSFGDLQYGALGGMSMDLLGAILFAGAGYTQDGDTRLYVKIGAEF